MTLSKIALLEIDLYLPGITSLKGKRSVVKSILARSHQQFGVASAEVGQLDKWQVAVLAFVCVSNADSHNEKVLNQLLHWIEMTYLDIEITRHSIEII